MLTNKGKYGLKAMIHLAKLAPDENAIGADIARLNNIPKKFLDGILHDLRNAGMVRTKKGPGGGYGLARPAVSIMTGAIVRALDGPLAPIACASRTAFHACEDCDEGALCAVRKVMSRVRDAMAGVLDTTTLADLAENNSILCPIDASIIASL